MKRSRRHGFTLVEMLVAIVVLSILTIGMVKVFQAQHQAQLTQNRGVERTMNSRAAIDMIARELRNAGYDPRGVGGAGLLTTDPSDVAWTADLNSDGDTDDADEAIRYYFDAVGGTIKRESGGATAVVADNIQGLTFTYLTADLAVAGEGDAVRHVNIAVDYETPQGVMAGALETQVAIRNQIFQVCSVLPNVLIDGNFEVANSPRLLGCGKSLHVNGNLKLGGTLTVAGSVSTSGTLTGSGKVEDENGNAVAVVDSAPQMEVPSYENPVSSHCDNADYTLTSQGHVIVESTGQDINATSGTHYGWEFRGGSPVVWELKGNTAYPGLFCVEGSAKVSGSPAKDHADAAGISIIAKGSIEVTGQPHVVPDADAQGFLFLAGGDVKIAGEVKGSGSGSADGGIVYAWSQCEINNKVTAASQLICKNKETPGYAKELVANNKLANSPTLTSGCTGDCD